MRTIETTCFKKHTKEICLTINLVEDLLDLFLTPITMNVHFQHTGLEIQSSIKTREQTDSKERDLFQSAVKKTEASCMLRPVKQKMAANKERK
jgi:hypothetical protein